MTEERWLPVLGHDHYEVSDHGRVRSLSSMRHGHCPTCTCGEVLIRRGKVLTPFPTKKGHLCVSLDRSERHRVHILVLEAFVGPRPEGLLGLHRDGNPKNNHVDNLYWGTYSDNSRDAVRHGTHRMTRRTECKRGHPLDGVRLNVDGSVRRRYCTICTKAQSRAWRQAHKPEKKPPRFTPEQMDAIRRDPRSMRAVGAEYGVSHTTIRRIRNN